MISKTNKTIRTTKWLQFAAAIVVYIAIISYIIIRASSNNFDINKVLDFGKLLRLGMKNTILISIYSVVLGSLLGFILYLLRESKIHFIKSLSNIFIEVMMGTPLLVLVFISKYFIGEAFDLENDYFIGVAAITAYIGPYMANMFKGAIDSIDPQQYVVMDLYGFTGFQKYRYIILPQIARRMMPPLMNNLSYAIKGSSLLYIITITEVYYSIKLIQSKTYAYTEGYIVLWLAYLCITIPLTLISKRIESKQV